MTKYKVEHYDLPFSRRNSSTRPTEIPSPERAKSHIINDAFVFVSILGTIGLQFTGMFLPGWWSLPPESKGAGGEDINVNDSKAIKLGLWFTVVCNSSSCYSRPTDTSGSNAWLQVTHVFESGAIAFCVLALGCHAMTRVKDDLEFYVLIRRLCVFLLSAAGSSIVIGLALFVTKSAELSHYPQRTGAVGHVGWPAAFSLAAAIVSLLTAGFVGVLLHQKLKSQLSERSLYWME